MSADTMSSIKNPSAKKAKSLERDHRTFAWEGNKSFRGLWRKKKRALTKQERRATDSVLNLAGDLKDEDIESPRRQVPRELHKTGVVTLKEALKVKTGDRAQRFSLK
ncbi:hypothetical protein [Brevifollis gellanilyticus]|nr:hypothetical protein [Brevifollis gellanilyticus]